MVCIRLRGLFPRLIWANGAYGDHLIVWVASFTGWLLEVIKRRKTSKFSCCCRSLTVNCSPTSGARNTLRGPNCCVSMSATAPQDRRQPAHPRLVITEPGVGYRFRTSDGRPPNLYAIFTLTTPAVTPPLCRNGYNHGMMKLTRDPFVGRLLAVLALYAAMVAVWMSSSPLPVQGATPSVRGVR